MKRNFTSIFVFLAVCTTAQAAPRGVSPYLPVNLSPEMERQIEQVLILADQPVLTRPIAASRVYDALPAACKLDEALCASVRRYLNRFMHSSGITDASVEAGNATDETRPAPNQHGMDSDSVWQASARVYWQPSDYAMLTLGAVAYDGDVTPTGSLLSVGFEFAQLDIGYRDFWLSPLMDSSMTLSTESATMPSVTLSNYTPLTRLGLRYQIFAAEMERSSNIVTDTGTTTGKPKLVGTSLSIEPVSGWAFGVNRALQFGGGERGGKSISDVFEAFFDPTRYDNEASFGEQFGNQVASITSSFLYPGATPFAVNIEYAGEDTVRDRNYLLGNAALSVGIRWPVLFERFDLALEVTEWQNAWYVHPIYGDGLANNGHIIGHWAVDQRVLNDDVGGQSGMVRLGWRAPFGGLAQLRYRTWQYEEYADNDYSRGQELTLGYDRQFGEFTAGAEVIAGRDAFGEDYALLRGHVRYSDLADAIGGGGTGLGSAALARKSELFVEAGVSANKVRIDENSELPIEKTSLRTAPHIGFGARRLGANGNDVGVRVEIDDVEGHLLTAVRAVDYRHRFDNALAVSFFLGAARYDRATAAYGLYYGAGAQWRDLFEGWDLGLDVRYAEKVSRDHVLPEDQFGERPVSYYDIYGANLYLTRRF